MSHSLPYSIPYITAPATQYVLPSHTHHAHAHIPGSMHLVSPAQIRTEPTQRKRPKYTRSKTGCLTCRAKKIKCDEGKPKCHRCEQAHRECTWPDPAPPKKKTPMRKSTAPQGNAAAVDSASRASGSPISRDATPSTRDMGDSVNSTSVGSNSQTDLTRRYSDSQNYAYLESNASMNRRQTETVYCSQVDPVSSAPINNTGTALSSYSYDFHQHSPNGSISSRSNSRPSTANSLPPPTHFGNTPHHSTIDSRDYRWDTLPTHRPEATYAYYPTA